ncbi:MAG: LytTR family DNA-binding domain-containing protein [Lachnospiraceae bacterium]
MSSLPPTRPRRLRITVRGCAPSDVPELRTLVLSKFRDRYSSIEFQVEQDSPLLELPERGGTSLRIPFHDIESVTSCGHYTELCCGTRTCRVRIPFSRVEKRLEGGPFLLVNRGVLLNMDHIQRTGNNGFVMDSGAFFAGRCRSFRSTRRAYEDYLLKRAEHTET